LIAVGRIAGGQDLHATHAAGDFGDPLAGQVELLGVVAQPILFLDQQPQESLTSLGLERLAELVHKAVDVLAADEVLQIAHGAPASRSTSSLCFTP